MEEVTAQRWWRRGRRRAKRSWRWQVIRHPGAVERVMMGMRMLLGMGLIGNVMWRGDSKLWLVHIGREMVMKRMGVDVGHVIGRGHRWRSFRQGTGFSRPAFAEIRRGRIHQRAAKFRLNEIIRCLLLLLLLLW